MKQLSLLAFAAIMAMAMLTGCPAILEIVNDYSTTTTTTTATTIPPTTTTISTTTTVPTTTTSTTTTTTIVSNIDTLSSANAASGYEGKLPVVSSGRQYIVQNNIIVSPSAQVVEYSTDSGNFEIKEQTGSSSTLPVAFPSIFIGNNNGHETADSNLPIRNSSIDSFLTTWVWSDLNVSATADFLPAYSLWFTTSNTGNILGPNKWLEIWMFKPPSHNPSGTQIESNSSIDESLWNIWKDGSNITYVAVSALRSVNLDLGPFITYAVSKETISNTDYLHDVIAGFKIWSNGAGLSSSGFSAIVR
jgi:hypothetical protein